MRSKYAELLNRLDAMQQAPYYATARETLADAERTIVALETALTELVHAYDAMPDGELGKGLTNSYSLTELIAVEVEACGLSVETIRATD